MIKNLTHRNPEDLAEINSSIGEEFGFWPRVRQGGTKSPKYIIASSSNEIKKHLIKAHNINYSHMERRPYGIIVNFYSVLNHFVWVIPYEDILIQRLGEGYKISAGKEYIRFSSKLSSRSHRRFFTRIMKERIYREKQLPNP